MKTNNINRIAIYLILCLIGISSYSCKNAQRAINSGDYDYVIDRSVHKLRKNKNKSKTIVQLEEAYNKANQRSEYKIQQLKKEGNPDNYVRIYETYLEIADRQIAVRPLLPLYIKKEDRFADIETKDIRPEATAFKNKSAEYLYTKAQVLLDKGGKYDARHAYTLLKKLDSFYPRFRDTRKLLSQANSMGSNYVLFEMKNKTGVPMPPNFESELSKLGVRELDQLWAEFHTQKQPNIRYDYKIVMNVIDVALSPEVVTENIITREKEIVDGWQYVLDKRGNVMKDSLGNDIKVDIVRTVRCDISEFTQNKEANIKASIDFVDLNSNKILGVYPVSAGSGFNHQYGQPRGDLRALNKHDQRLCDTRPLPFPSDRDLLIQAGYELKPAVERLIARNDDLVLR